MSVRRKLLVLESCAACPRCTHQREPHCYDALEKGRVPADGSIPEWCPLMDAKQLNAAAVLQRLLAAIDEPQLVGDFSDALLEARELVT